MIPRRHPILGPLLGKRTGGAGGEIRPPPPGRLCRRLPHVLSGATVPAQPISQFPDTRSNVRCYNIMMLFENTSFIGIDPTAGKRPMAYAALDGDLRLISLVPGRPRARSGFPRRAAPGGCCCVRAAPPQHRRYDAARGQAAAHPPPRPGRWTKYRVVEYQLRRHRISTYQTPEDEQKCPRWMKMGFNLYRRLEGLGFQPYPAGESSHQYLEVYPHACFTALLGVAPFPEELLWKVVFSGSWFSMRTALACLTRCACLRRSPGTGC